MKTMNDSNTLAIQVDRDTEKGGGDVMFWKFGGVWSVCGAGNREPPAAPRCHWHQWQGSDGELQNQEAAAKSASL